jgi:hypothetical protein
MFLQAIHGRNWGGYCSREQRSLRVQRHLSCSVMGPADGTSAAEADPWTGYTGTYATAVGASGSPKARLKAAQSEASATASAPRRSGTKRLPRRLDMVHAMVEYMRVS